MPPTSDIERRLMSLEEEDRRLRDALGKLVTNTEVMNNTLQILTGDISPRMENLEKEVRGMQNRQSTNTLILDVVKWFAALIAGSSVTMAMVYLFQNGGS
ncbi:MAG: hypothetical protein CMH22_05315 [Methylophaga sp.]|nr:hypothetical protein [Methylophaga sp.]MAX51377.1 hypothetical protein [Methylophaga sp.]|tara:strand:+ start:1926 stop:2225 length:300 start_codon:yes stop_codon:yes gene_type:complete